MSRHATEFQEPVQECAPSPPLPADHVLNSGAVLFPGAFDQHGCPLVVFPVDGQAKLNAELSKAEVVDFINYFLCLHNKKQEKESLVSVVADLRYASLPTTRFIAETLLLLELHRRTVHSVYIVQPKKKDVVKALLKLLAPSKSYAVLFKKVLLKEISELSNYIDRSQLPAQLGGYLIYCHLSWVAFIKEIDAFVQEFLSVVQRLPSCISALQALSRLPLPSTFSELQHFCSTNEAKFQQLGRELGLDKLLRYCERLLEKLRYPETEPCYQAMAGTALFTHTAFDMRRNHSRITAAVEKVELLWQQAFSKAHLQLQVFQLREDALQITEQIQTLLQEKLQPYKMEIAKDAAEAVMLVSEFEASIHAPAMALVGCAEDVIHTLADILPFDAQTGERWAPDLRRLKEKLHSAVLFILQTLRAVSNYHRCYNKASCWYSLVLCENFLQELLSGVNGDTVPIQRQRTNWGANPAWRHKISTFLKKNPPPHVEELVHLAHLSNAIPDNDIQQEGKQMSQRCMTLRKLLISSGPVAVGHLQLALQWQYELLWSISGNHSSADRVTSGMAKDVQDLTPKCEEGARPLGTSSNAISGMASAVGKPPSLSSFDSGFDGAGSSPLEAWGGREGLEGLSRLAGTRDSVRPAMSQPQIHTDNISSVVSGLDFGSVGNSSRASVRTIPRATVESLNFEIEVKRSAALPSNPWLSLPVDNLENSYTVTITQNPTPQKRDPQFYDPFDPYTNDKQSGRSRDQPTQTEVFSSTQPRGPQGMDWILHSHSSLENPELSPICNVLSSTITEGRDKSICTTEGIPTLLWDSYDLHDQNRDSVDGLTDISLNDWDVKEQEGLGEVEKILDRADEILEKEETVLAQEAVLDALLRSEDRRNQWSLWDSGDQLGVMSASELAEAGVLGLEDYLHAEADSLSEQRSTGSNTNTEDAGPCTAVATGTDTAAFHNRLDLLTELKKIQVLDELIMVENTKLHELRRCNENPTEELSRSKSLDTNGPLNMSKGEEAFQLQAENTQAVLGPDVSEQTVPQEPPDSPCQDHCSQDEPTMIKSTTSDFREPPEEVGIQPRGCINGKELNICAEICKPEASLTLQTRAVDGAFNPGGTPHLPPVPKPRKALFQVNDLAEHEPPHSSELQNPALSSVAQGPTFVQLDQQDKPVDALPENVTQAGSRNLVLDPNVKVHSSSNNNNNNNHALPEKWKVSLSHLSEVTTKDEQDVSVVPACLLQTDLLPADEIQAVLPAECPHQQPPPPMPPDQPLEVDPRGRVGQNEDLPDGFQSSSMRTSSPGSAGTQQAQLNNDRRKMTADFKTPLVLDTGSGLMKAGFADKDLPSIIFPTIIGMPKYEEVMSGNFERETYIGHEAQHMRGVLALKRPIKNGIIRNWDEMEKMWHHTFQQLCVDPEDHPVLLTEAAMNPLANRQRMVEIMFECFNVPFTYVAMQAVLALYAAGRSTGVVFDSGDGVSHSVPVFEGYCLPHAVQRFPLAGANVTMHLKELLQEQGVCMRTTAEVEIVREMKEKCCYVALDYEAQLNQGGLSHREMHYTMPDGQIVTLSTARFRAPEILFKPQLIGRDHYGMHESIFKSILSSDIDLRSCFLRNIILSGGNTLLDGLPERLKAEIKGLLPTDKGGSVCVTSPRDRDFSVWSGGAVLANLPTFCSVWISQDEYEEFGPEIVFRKCF